MKMLPAIRFLCVFPVVLIAISISASVHAASIEYDVQSVCKFKQVFGPQDYGPGFIFAFCAVNARPVNYKELRMAQVGNVNDGYLPPQFFIGTAMSRASLSANPFITGGAGHDPAELKSLLMSPFQSLNKAVADFTGDENIDLGFPDWSGLQDLPNMGITNTYSMINSNFVSQQAVVPIPASGVLLGSGLVGLIGLLAWRNVRIPMCAGSD